MAPNLHHKSYHQQTIGSFPFLEIEIPYHWDYSNLYDIGLSQPRSMFFYMHICSHLSWLIVPCDLHLPFLPKQPLPKNQLSRLYSCLYTCLASYGSTELFVDISKNKFNPRKVFLFCQTKCWLPEFRLRGLFPQQHIVEFIYDYDDHDYDHNQNQDHDHNHHDHDHDHDHHDEFMIILHDHDLQKSSPWSWWHMFKSNNAASKIIH